MATYTNDKVQVSQVGINIRQTIVKHENVKDAVQVQEQQTIGEAVVQTKEDDNRLRDHNLQGHGGDESDLLEHINLFLGNQHLLGVVRALLLDRIGNNNARQRLGQETHTNHKERSNDGVDPKDPGQAHIGVLGDPLTNGRANTGSRIGRGDEEGHGLTSTVRVTKEVGNGAGDVAQGDTSGSSGEELEDDQHRQVERLGAADVEEGVEEDGANIDPFAATNITARRRFC